MKHAHCACPPAAQQRRVQQQHASHRVAAQHGTIKPLDAQAILASVRKTRCVVTAEEHQMNGGLGDSIAQLLAREEPLPLEMVAVNDSFGESATPDQLMEKYKLNEAAIVAAVEAVLKRKK